MSTSTHTPTHPAKDDEYDGPILGPAHDGHPSDLQYIGVAIFLAIITGIEVAASYIGEDNGIKAGAMLVMAAIKFAVVALYFMHLKFDSKNFRRLFVTGIVLALFCYIVVLMTFQFFS